MEFSREFWRVWDRVCASILDERRVGPTMRRFAFLFSRMHCRNHAAVDGAKSFTPERNNKYYKTKVYYYDKDVEVIV
jgi:hypothetical protein